MDEPRWESKTLVVFELEAYPEPKVLSASDLRVHYQRYKSFWRAAEVIDASEGLVRQNIKQPK